MAMKKTAGPANGARYVVFRSNLSGVWFGELSEESGPQTRVLLNARRAFSWSGALTCSTLAIKGPGKGSRICGEVIRVEIDRAPGDEMIVATVEAASAWLAAPVES